MVHDEMNFYKNNTFNEKEGFLISFYQYRQKIK